MSRVPLWLLAVAVGVGTAQKIPDRPRTVAAPPPRAKAKAVDAATRLRTARNLERAGRMPSARHLYSRVIRDFPGTPEAKAAEDGIRSLGRR